MPVPNPDFPELKVEMAFVEDPLSDYDPDDIFSTSPLAGWHDVTSVTRSVTVDRGRANDLEQFDAGTATVVLDNRTRDFDPINQLSPYWETATRAVRTNLMPNPSFEVDLAGWKFNNATATRVETPASYARFGRAALRLAPTATTNQLAVYNDGASGALTADGRRIAVKPLTTYRASGYVRATTAGFNGSLIVHVYDSTNTQIAAVASTVTTTTSAWVRLDVSFTTAATAASIMPIFSFSSSLLAGEILIDGVMIEATSTLNPYIDGSFLEGDWLGQPHYSGSVLNHVRQNMLVDPSLDTATDWQETLEVIAGVATLTVDTRYGDFAMELATGGFGLNTRRMAARPAQDYGFSLQIKAVSANFGLRVEYQFTDDIGSNIQLNTYNFTVRAGAWQFIQVPTATAPANTKFVRVAITTPSGASTIAIIEDLQLEAVFGNYPRYFRDAAYYNDFYYKDIFYIDGSGNPQTATVSVQKSRIAQTTLKPRRQIRISGIYPHDVVTDGFAYNLIDGTTYTPTAGLFSTRGLKIEQIGNVNAYSNANMMPVGTTELKVSAYLEPSMYEWAAANFPMFGVSGLFAVEWAEQELRLYRWDGAFWIPQAVVTDLYETYLSYNPRPSWFKVELSLSGSSVAYQLFVGTTLSYDEPVNDWDMVANGLLTGTYSSLAGDLTLKPTVAKYTYGSTEPTSFLGDSLIFKRLCVTANNTKTVDLLLDSHVSIFQGYTAGFPQDYTDMGKDSTVQLQCFDMMGLLGNMKTPPDYGTYLLRNIDLFGRWKLGDTGTTAIDYSGNNHDLEYRGDFRTVQPSAIVAGTSNPATRFGLQAPVAGTYGSVPTGYIASGHAKPTVNSVANFQEQQVAFWFELSAFEFTATTQRMVLFTMEDTSISTRPLLQVYVQPDASNLSIKRMGISLYVNGASSNQEGIVGQPVRANEPVFVSARFSSYDFCLVETSYINQDVLYQTAFDATLISGGINYVSGGRIVLGGFESTIATNRCGLFGALSDVVLSDQLFSATALWNAGKNILPELSWQRLDRIADFVNIPNRLRNYEASSSAICGAINYVGDTAVLELMQKVEDTEVGLLFGDREGRLAFLQRYYLSERDTGKIVQASFNDEGTAIGFNSLRYAFDADQLVNDTTVVDDGANKYQYEDDDSIDEYGRRSRQIDTLLNETEDARQMSIGLTNIYKDPLLRADEFGIEPLNHDWFDVLPLELGDRINLRSTPMGVGDAIDQDMALQGIKWSLTPKDWNVSVVGSPRPIVSYFQLGGYLQQEQRINFMPNSSFESTNISRWSGLANVLLRVTTQSKSGAASLQAASTASNSAPYIQTGSIPFRYWFPEVAFYASAYLSFWVRTSTGRAVNATFTLQNSVFSTVGSATTGNIFIAANTWTQIKLTIPVGSWTGNPEYAVIRLNTQPNGSPIGSQTWIDDILLEYEYAYLPYFDGTFAEPYKLYDVVDLSFAGDVEDSVSYGTWAYSDMYVDGSELDSSDILGF